MTPITDYGPVDDSGKVMKSKNSTRLSPLRSQTMPSSASSPGSSEPVKHRWKRRCKTYTHELHDSASPHKPAGDGRLGGAWYSVEAGVPQPPPSRQRQRENAVWQLARPGGRWKILREPREHFPSVSRDRSARSPDFLRVTHFFLGVRKSLGHGELQIVPGSVLGCHCS